MRAAVVSSFDAPPELAEFPAPVPRDDEVLINVRAAALSPLVKSQASGKHYSSHSALPIVPGVDGTGRLEDGRRVYFAFPTPPHGALAEQVAIPRAFLAELPDDLDDVTAAAIANPGMSAWAGLMERAQFRAGEGVLVNGATGSAGRLAVQIAKHLGASRIVATGRNAASVAPLRALGADVVIPLDQAPAALREALRNELMNHMDVVLDYLWGPPAERILEAMSGHGAHVRRIRFVQIGSIAGGSIPFPAAALRSTQLELMGSGLGSVSRERLVASIRALLAVVTRAGLRVEAEPVPLAQVREAWNRSTSARLVFTL